VEPGTELPDEDDVAPKAADADADAVTLLVTVTSVEPPPVQAVRTTDPANPSAISARRARERELAALSLLIKTFPALPPTSQHRKRRPVAARAPRDENAEVQRPLTRRMQRLSVPYADHCRSAVR
jgi:hypothetical protein